MLDTKGRKFFQGFVDVLAKPLAKKGISPNSVTLVALCIGIISAIIYGFKGPFYITLILLWLSGYLDAVDGAMSRIMDNASKVGTLIDITSDRLVELVLLITIAFMHPESGLPILVTVSMFVLSMTVFLTVGALTPKKGKKSFYYQPGLVERTEGFIFISLMIIFPQWLNIIAYIFAAGVLITAIQRFIEGYRLLKKEDDRDK